MGMILKVFIRYRDVINVNIIKTLFKNLEFKRHTTQNEKCYNVRNEKNVDSKCSLICQNSSLTTSLRPKTSRNLSVVCH